MYRPRYCYQLNWSHKPPDMVRFRIAIIFTFQGMPVGLPDALGKLLICKSSESATGCCLWQNLILCAMNSGYSWEPETLDSELKLNILSFEEICLVCLLVISL